MFPAVAEADVRFLEDLVFFPAPGRLLEVGVQVVAVPLSDVLALHLRERYAQLVPRQFAIVKTN